MSSIKSKTYTFDARVWLYPSATASWHFVTVPKNISGEIQETYKDFKRGWGSLPVAVTIQNTSWNTSIFPDRKSGTYILPLKASVRKAEGIWHKDTISLSITITL